MSLFTLHKVMIITAIVFCAGFAVRGTTIVFRSGGITPFVLAVISAGGAVVLALYLRWLIRTKGRALKTGEVGRDN